MSKPEDIMKALAGVIGANDPEASVKHFLDTGFPPLNNASSANWDNGGPVGRVIEIAGPPSSGKTAIATALMTAAQKAGGIAAFMDHERSFMSSVAKKIGLDTTPGIFIYKKPETFEQSVDTFHKTVALIRDKKLIAKDAPIVWVFDSLAAMVPQSVLQDAKGNAREAAERNMNDNTALARATSAHFPAIAMIAEKYDVLVIFLNQMRKKIGVVFGDPRKTTGGDAPEFYFSQRLWLSAAQIKGPNGDVLGMEVSGMFVKNKVARPFAKAKWRFMFQPDGTGRFDVERSLIEFLNEEKLFPTTKPDGKEVRKGFVFWEGKEIARENLARQIEAEGPTGFAKLRALLPAAYKPPVVADVELAALVSEETKEAA
ncbi:protein RecA [Rhizobium sp. AN5]|uniref:recombinase n=1 Tax=Rhizobium sp. AN5 TaxID=1855304 RepID=UPI000BCF84C7|nr:recombinase [Rhizobium sp. AN5]SOC90110.1 protein RecA [Rhizobium sp. AN5]